jgi:hypothetical protein
MPSTRKTGTDTCQQVPKPTELIDPILTAAELGLTDEDRFQIREAT